MAKIPDHTDRASPVTAPSRMVRASVSALMDPAALLFAAVPTETLPG